QEVKDERGALLGAARLFFFEDFDERLPKKSRVDWAVRLAEIVLQHGYDRNKDIVLRYLGRCDESRVRTLLREVMLGKKGSEVKEADFDEPGVRAGAALSLALLRENDLKPEVAKLLAQSKCKADKAALQVTLALLGDHTQLRAEHFQLKSYTIGLGAIRAVEQFGGAHGLDLLIEKGLDHPWAHVRDEAELAVQRITGQKWPEDGRWNAIPAWWKAHGRAFVEQRRKEQAAKP